MKWDLVTTLTSYDGEKHGNVTVPIQRTFVSVQAWITKYKDRQLVCAIYPAVQGETLCCLFVDYTGVYAETIVGKRQILPVDASFDALKKLMLEEAYSQDQDIDEGNEDGDPIG